MKKACARLLRFFFVAPLLLCISSCMRYGPGSGEDFTNWLDPDIVTGKGLFIVNEGNFMYGNASLSYYDTETMQIQNGVFSRANGSLDLGDVAQSMIIFKGTGWIVVNNSGVVYAIDINTFKLKGLIKGFAAPRYMHFVSEQKAYVTQIWDERICIVNPKTFEITGYVETEMEKGAESTEQMVQYGKYVFTNCWSYNDRILVIDTELDEVVDEIKVGLQPTSLAMDRNGKLWTITDGSYDTSPTGEQAPVLYRIDAETRTIEKEFTFAKGDHPSEVQINADGDTLYFINNDIWKFSVTADRLPVRPFIESKGTWFYGLTVNPVNSEVYVADAIDHMQPGVIMRYSADGNLIDEFKAGIAPGAFCWR